MRIAATPEDTERTECGKPPVMLIHGMWCRPHVWANFRNFYEERGYRVVTPRLRHHNMESGSRPHGDLGTTSLLHYAADLEAEIRALGDKPLVIGHSMGGLLTQMLAARDLVRACVLLASAHCAPLVTVSASVARIFIRELTTPSFWNKLQKPSYAAMRWGVLNAFSEAEARDLYASLIPESGRSLFEIALWYFDRQRAALVDANQVNCPLLFMTGEHDRITPARLAARMAGYFGERARFEKLPGHAHWLPSEPGWQRIAERSLHFFEHEAGQAAEPAYSAARRGMGLRPRTSLPGSAPVASPLR